MGFKKDYACKWSKIPIKRPYRKKNNPNAVLSDKDKLFNRLVTAL